MITVHETLKNIGIKRLGVLLVAGVLLGPVSFSNAYAEANDEIAWKMVVVGSPVCDTLHRELLKTYSEITAEYLNLYELPNTATSIECVSEEDYAGITNNDDSELLIVIFDEILALKTMRSNVLDGFYMHTGNDRNENHVIVMCHCSNFEQGHERKYTSWILTHELSHFVLSWQGYHYTAVERLVHSIENKYEHCTSIEGEFCTEQIYVKSPNLTQSYPVFPLIEVAKGSGAIQTAEEDLSENKIILGVYKQLTEWWLDDTISNNAYLNATKQIFFTPVTLYSGMTIESGMELPNGVIILDHAKERPQTWKQVVYNDELSTDEEIKTLLEYVPQDIVNAKKESTSFGEIPQHYKQRAQYWIDGKISDSKFFNSIDRLVRMNVISLQ